MCIRDSINIEWTNYLEEIGHAITGAVYLEFLDVKEKMEGKPTKAVSYTHLREGYV